MSWVTRLVENKSSERAGNFPVEAVLFNKLYYLPTIFGDSTNDNSFRNQNKNSKTADFENKIDNHNE